MSETVKFRKFCSEDLGDKPVSEIPGVGPIAARKLRSMDYSKAKDLYSRLRKLNFDHKKFRVWVQLNCPGAKVATIFKALMGWHRQFGDQASGNESGDSSAVSPQARPMSRASIKGSGRASLPAARRPRNSVQFDLSRNERDNSPVNDVPIPNNALTLFFSSFSDSCKNILPEFHTDLKMEILSAVAKYENKSREKQSSGRAIANGV